MDEFSQAGLEGKPCLQACSQEAEASAGVWGVPSQRFQNIRKGYSETLLADVIGMF